MVMVEEHTLEIVVVLMQLVVGEMALASFLRHNLMVEEHCVANDEVVLQMRELKHINKAQNMFHIENRTRSSS